MAEIKRTRTPNGAAPARRVLVCPGHSHQLVQALQKLFKEEMLCDYTIIAEGQAFRTHRNIVAGVSDYFRAMLTGQMMEARQDHVELKGVSAVAVSTLLQFAYSGQLSLSLEDVTEILAGACHLQIRSAVELCSDFLLSEMSLRNCVDILNIAEMYSLATVRDHAFQLVLKCFGKLGDGEQLCKLSSGHMRQLLPSNSLNCVSELFLFQQVMHWINHDFEERGTEAVELLQHIRYALMKPEELVDQVSQTHFMLSEPKCRSFLDEALHYHVLPSRHPLMQTPRSQVRNQSSLVAFGGRYGIGVGYKYNSNQMHVLHDGKWYALPGSESNFLYSAVVVVDNFLYVCGGTGKPAHARATCQRYDPRTNSWTRIAHMKTRRQSFPLVSHSGALYALGGGTPVEGSFEHLPTENCERYSIDANEWHSITSLPECRKSSAACDYQSMIYLSGGRRQNETMSTLWCYDIHAGLWRSKASMLQPHAGHAMMAVQDKIYVIDRSGVGVECYNPLADDWSKVAVSGGVLSGIARPATSSPWVYFISCCKDHTDHQCIRLNVLTRTWEELPTFPDPVHCVIGTFMSIPLKMLTNNHGCNTKSVPSTSSK